MTCPGKVLEFILGSAVGTLQEACCIWIDDLICKKTGVVCHRHYRAVGSTDIRLFYRDVELGLKFLTRLLTLVFVRL